MKHNTGRVKTKTGLVWKSVCSVHPSPENSQLYRPILRDDPEIVALVNSIRERGILEPLIITEDDFIISGHRRHTAACMAGKRKIPCRIAEGVYHGDSQFLRLLREANRQREKNNEERLREEIISVNARDAYENLCDFRAARSEVRIETMKLNGRKRRSKISAAKMPMLNAARQVLREREEFLPINLRAIHYALLNHPPLRHVSKPLSRYRNDQAKLCGLVRLIDSGTTEWPDSDGGN